MSDALPLLAQVLIEPVRLKHLTLPEWDLVIRQGRIVEHGSHDELLPICWHACGFY